MGFSVWMSNLFLLNNTCIYLDYENMLNSLKDHSYTICPEYKKGHFTDFRNFFKNIHFLINSYSRIFILPSFNYSKLKKNLSLFKLFRVMQNPHASFSFLQEFHWHQVTLQIFLKHITSQFEAHWNTLSKRSSEQKQQYILTQKKLSN